MFAVQSPAQTINIHPIERMASVVGGIMLASAGVRKRSAGGCALLIAGAEMVRRGISGHSFLYQTMGTRTAPAGQGAHASVPYELGTRATATVTIRRPRPEVYRYWLDFTNLPRFMRHLKSVEMTGENRSRWVAQGPMGIPVSWNAEVINKVENERIGWRSVEGSVVDHAGSVQFKDTADSGTHVVVELQYNPPGGALGAMVAQLFGADPESEIQSDLDRLKYHLETSQVLA